MHMRRRIHAYAEEDTCICIHTTYTILMTSSTAHMRRRIHAYAEEDTCICIGGYWRQTLSAFKRDLLKRQKRPSIEAKETY
jgi:hypothetical protein